MKAKSTARSSAAKGNAFSNHCSLFPTGSVIAEFKDELKAFQISKGTIQFPVDKPLSAALFEKDGESAPRSKRTKETALNRAAFVQTLEPSRSWLPRLHAWLSPAEPARLSDLIFVLAGRMSSKHFALQLFREGLSPKLLFSVGRFEIRRFSKMALPVPLNLLELTQAVPPLQRHYFVLFQGKESHVEHIPPRRFGTLTEIAALARWLDKHPKVQSLTLISNEAHLRRIGMCCRSLLPRGVKVALLAVPHSLAESADQEPSAFQSTRSDLLELFKLLVYRILLTLRRDGYGRPSSS